MYRRTLVGTNEDEAQARAFLEKYSEEYSQLVTESTRASWNYETNMTDHNAAIVEEVGARVSAYSDAANSQASLFDVSSFSYDTRRLLDNVGSLSLSPEEMTDLSQTLNQMSRIYGSHKVRQSSEKCYSLEPELTQLMSSSTNATERLWAWQQWHEGVGRAIRPLYVKYVDLENRHARLNGYEDYGDQWRQKYETKELESIVQQLYKQVEPLYRQLHAYVRRKLYETYGAGVVDITGPLPAHLVGDMWGRFWSDLGDIVQPFRNNKSSVDPTPAMMAQNCTVRRMFEMGSDFFVSMGLKPVPETFFNLSMLEKPSDREVVCHATAWDFNDGQDFRIRMCAGVSFSDFLTVHHELGHIQYQMQYAHLPYGYRDGANDGFHEAIGELMSMSVATTKHLHSVGLLEALEDDPVEINFLMQQALSSVSTLPFHLVQDIWRWKLFRGEIPEEEWNRAYWKEKIETVGVAPPLPRDDPQDLDPVALYHVSGDFDMIRYFTRTVMQFQFAEALCNVSGHVGPLHKCDFYNSTEAGSALVKMFSMGSSKPWPDAMETLTGQREMSAQPLLNYFRPLEEWLEKQNARNGEMIGWKIPPSSAVTVIPTPPLIIIGFMSSCLAFILQIKI
ncbi:hypothetical protein DAPPUDRAFT_65345 [Daphnia pulex]|uniref:Angiotensin-converting enzyme n=1 Tax=Daphnia pulex TaxID=6669 RepID=E9HRD6_DAPPU|nr:hypothetical protein DAPPUDRAFT_65345 [Daphnia pulex]|eukprot:EFX65684.1 hypothetical protein DAPPUDRAFT_65345 [Daphnia pulex]